MFPALLYLKEGKSRTDLELSSVNLALFRFPPVVTVDQ